MSGKRLTTEMRASRQKVMMALRGWMTSNDVSRRDVADKMGITTGHLSTLINANRTPSQEQVDIAKGLMSEDLLPAETTAPPPVKAEKTKRTDAGLRPLTQVEGDFVANVAKAWLKDNKGSTQAEFVEVVRALSIAIRT